MKNQRTPESITVTISRTIQIQQYQPLTISIAETHNCDEDEDPQEVRNTVYKQVAESVSRYLNREYKRYMED
jgi:hypothetical protein